MRPHAVTPKTLLIVQAVVAVALVGGWFAMAAPARQEFKKQIFGEVTYPKAEISRDKPLRIPPLYDNPNVVSDEELAAVLEKVRPRFAHRNLKPNYVEHALRTWHIDATFQDPAVMSGEEMKDFLCDHGKFLESWSSEGRQLVPLHIERPEGMAIRWNRDPGGSVHHDHWLACLTEAGVSIDEPVYGPNRRMTIREVVQEGFRDLALDERETEWSALAFALWLPESNTWYTTRGRQLSFDQLARRLMRGHCRFGVCSGSHRVYTLMVLWRIDEEERDILSDKVQAEVYAHLEMVRDLIKESQFENGRWPSNWSMGKAAVEDPLKDAPYRSVIATGHHLEWLAIAPEELHPPKEMIYKAADWLIADVAGKSIDEIQEKYTFYSHVGNALCLWRKTRATDFWQSWQRENPWEPQRKPVEAARP